MEWYKANDISHHIKMLIKKLDLSFIDEKRIVCLRSQGSKSNARARIWSFPRVWQLALNLPAHYVIEVIAKHFDKLSEDDKFRVLIHELLHIPKNFSGSLKPHYGKFERIDRRRVETLFQKFKQKF